MLSRVLSHGRGWLRSPRWRWLDAAQNVDDIPVGDLIGPLRFDVIALRDFLRFYLTRPQLVAGDFDRFVAEVRRLRFYDWKFVSHDIREPHTTRDAATFAPFFAAEVRQALDVWHALRGGFDPRFPIEVRVTDRLRPATSGKRIQARYILGDGSHRLACLMVQGYTVLPRDHYRIRWFRSWQPFDATWLLTSRGRLPGPEYLAFLSEIYGAPRALPDAERLLHFVATARPDRLEEVREVLRVDGFAVAP